jgi:hypothetical protein
MCGGHYHGFSRAIQSSYGLQGLPKRVIYRNDTRGAAMAEEETKSFVIRDRRGRADQTDEPTAGSSSPSSTAQDTPRPPASSTEPAHDHEPRQPVTFSSFIFSLGTSALMLMGEQLDPQQGRVPVNLSQAKEIIDILSILEGKTKGNLTADEQTVLTDMLYALRLKYVDLASAKPATKSP